MRWMATSITLAALIAGLSAQQAPGQPPRGQSAQPQQPSRDTSARPQDQAPAPTGRISGRVVAADSGRPVKRARVFINAAELQGGRGGLTDDNGAYDFTDLPAGRYTV